MSGNNRTTVSSPTTNPHPSRPLIHQVRRMFVILLVTIVGALALLAYFQRRLIYHPEITSRMTVSDFGLDRCGFDVTVPTHDGLDLYGWLVLAKSSKRVDSNNLGQAITNDRLVVLYFPGNAGHRGYRMSQLMRLQSLDVHALLVDYRGYGDNAGHPTEAALARDARTVWDHLTEKLGVSPGRIVIYGESLGGGVATRLASELCQGGMIPAGLIVQSTFDSLVAAAQFHFPYLPVSWLLIDRFPSATRITQVTCPVLSIHGSRDSIVPFVNGQRLFAAAPPMSNSGVTKKMLTLPNTDHNDVYGGQDTSLMIEGLDRFFDERLTSTNQEPDQ
ncbi:alpha/beta hydrolase [Schlesneria paludicola]|uniref:alpha/beta hydrolase n=1 Tax=Schlesneria paludicola TaxID=360056 RepID=UPI000302464D|nr:alpha/beta hydrolase [Schlesneria paludicola]